MKKSEDWKDCGESMDENQCQTREALEKQDKRACEGLSRSLQIELIGVPGRCLDNNCIVQLGQGATSLNASLKRGWPLRF